MRLRPPHRPLPAWAIPVGTVVATLATASLVNDALGTAPAVDLACSRAAAQAEPAPDFLFATGADWAQWAERAAERRRTGRDPLE